MARERTQAEIQQLRGMSREARHELNINRIADALEDIRDELRATNQRMESNPLR